jgi:MFS family permease
LTAATLPGRDPVLRRDAQVIGLVGLAHGTSHFFQLILVPLFPWLKEVFALSYAELGLLMSVFFVVSGVGQALAGFIVDRIGALAVLLTGVALLGVSALGLASSQSYATLMLFAGVAGLGNSVFHPADFTILNQRVSPARLGHAFSMHGILGTFGWAIAPLFLAGIAAFAGWRVALLCASAVAFSVLAALISFRILLDTSEVAHAAHLPKDRTSQHALSFMRLPGVWMCFAFFFITAMALGGVQNFAPSALQELYGMPIALAMACITVFMLASAGGMVVGGFLAARVPQHEKIIAVAFATVGAIAALVASGAIPSALVVVLIGLIGFGSGIAGPSRDLLVRAAAPRNATGRVYGVVYSGLDVGVSISPLMFGALMDAHHPGGVFVLIGSFQALALFTALGIGGSTARTRTQAA